MDLETLCLLCNAADPSGHVPFSGYGSLATQIGFAGSGNRLKPVVESLYRGNGRLLQFKSRRVRAAGGDDPTESLIVVGEEASLLAAMAWRGTILVAPGETIHVALERRVGGPVDMRCFDRLLAEGLVSVTAITGSHGKKYCAISAVI